MLEVCPAYTDISAYTTTLLADSGINDRLDKLRSLIDQSWWKFNKVLSLWHLTKVIWHSLLRHGVVVFEEWKLKLNQTVNDGVAHCKNPRKCAYHVTFDLDLDLEHILDARWPGVHLVKVWWRSGHLCARRSDLRKSLQTDGQTDRRRTPRHCISSFLEWAKKN